MTASSREQNQLTVLSCDDDRMADRWAAIDEHILSHRIVQALKALRDEFGYSIPQAIDAFDTRYKQLRGTRPDEFAVRHEDYGKNVYT
jgi:hypothetical protein